MVQVFHNPNFLNDCFKGTISDLSQCYLVAEVKTDNLEHAYGLTQNYDGKIWSDNELLKAFIPVTQRRSTSWGDLMIIDGARYFVDGQGYRVLEV